MFGDIGIVEKLLTTPASLPAFVVSLRRKTRMMHPNRHRKAFLIKRIVDEHYVPNSHRGSLVDIYRRHVNKLYPMSLVTFYRLVEYAIAIDGFVGNGPNRVPRERREPKNGGPLVENQLSMF